MIRRFVFMGVGLTTIGFLVFGRHLGSYMRTATGWVTDSVKQSVPLEFEITRARNEVKDIMPEIRKNMQIIAKEEVEVDRLGQEINSLEKKQDKDRTDLMSLKTEAASGKSVFHFAGRTYSADQVKCDLANRFERFKTSDATLASLHEILTARQQSLEAARQKLEGMLAAKRQLEVDVENLEARLKMVEVAQTASNYQFDDSQLGRVKELIGDLRSRLTVEEKMVHAEGSLQGEIPVEQPATENIVDRVSEYFGGATADTSKVAEAIAGK
jgi:predicted  nucleic acid-binding Zn-ribbon protein